jgi:hypothetical protein
MINYEKLKNFIDTKIKMHSSSQEQIKKFMGIETGLELEYFNGSIGALQVVRNYINELVKPGPKYEIGQEVWFSVFGNIYSHTIDGINLKGGYEFEGVGWFKEQDLFPTRQDLIEHQINYWSALIDCDHEYDLLSGFRCTKCGKKPELTVDNKCPECSANMGATAIRNGNKWRAACSECNYIREWVDDNYGQL